MLTLVKAVHVGCMSEDIWLVLQSGGAQSKSVSRPKTAIATAKAALQSNNFTSADVPAAVVRA